MNTQGSLLPFSFQAFQLSPLEIQTTSSSDNMKHITVTATNMNMSSVQATAAHQAIAIELEGPKFVTACRHTYS